MMAWLVCRSLNYFSDWNFAKKNKFERVTNWVKGARYRGSAKGRDERVRLKLELRVAWGKVRVDNSGTRGVE
jgi:hypothetical protein